MCGHEFHYATLSADEVDAPLIEAFDAEGCALEAMGHGRGSTTGSFLHVITRQAAEPGSRDKKAGGGVEGETEPPPAR